MSLSTQRLGTVLHWRKTSAPRRQAWRDCTRRFEGESSSPTAVERFFTGGAAAFKDGACSKACDFIQSIKTRREACGTSAKRMPTRPEVSCHTTSPESRTTDRSEEHTSELQSRFDLVCRLLL